MQNSPPVLEYPVVIYYDVDDACWIADAPDLRFCTTHGDTPQQALAEIMIAMPAWLEVQRQREVKLPVTHQPKPFVGTHEVLRVG